ncbi:MAG: protein translocase subunit SecD [Dichotomicrobium sp.]
MLYFSPWKIGFVVALILLGLAYALPNALPKQTLPDWLPNKQVHLGLDLQGGSHLLLEINTEELRSDWLEAIVDDVRTALRDQRIGYRNLRITDGHVLVTIRDAAQVDQAFEAISDLAQPLEGNLMTGASGGQTIEVSRQGDARLQVDLTEEALAQRLSSALSATIETIRRRIDALGTTEPTIQRQGVERVLVQVPGLQDPERLKDLLGQTAKLTFQLVDQSMSVSEAESGRPPPGSAVYPSDDGSEQQYLLKKRAIISGEDLVDAQPSFDQRSNEPIVTFRFNSSGARRFGDVTSENVGQPFAIVLDGKVISAPVIQEPILGGTGQISGDFTVEEANNLAILLRSGALPASLTILQERTVGPSLGKDSIAAGQIAGVVGLIGVIVFMFVSYGLFGVFANIALLANIAMILGVLSALQATLTLPGIAGIVLTIGMAVDANTLIFERIREELRAGKTPIAAIDVGFARSAGTILDANITTFIAAAILFWLGSGPIRGFAVTLSIGILTSVFTALMFTRMMIALWLQRTRPRTVPI